MEKHPLFEEPIESMLTAIVHVFSYSVFCTCSGNDGTKWFEKYRNDTAGQSIDIEWHVCPGTSVQILHKPQVFMSETGHAPESFPDRIILASMFNDITNWKSPTVQTMCLAQAREVASYATRFRPRCWVSVVQDRERPGHIMSVDHVTNLLTVNGTNSLSR